MNYPKEIQLGGHIIKVELINNRIVSENDNHVADFCRDNNTIRIAVMLEDGTYKSLSFINECLHHEILEAINEVFCLEFEQDEIDRIAQGYVQVLGQLGIRLIDVESGTQGTA